MRGLFEEVEGGLLTLEDLDEELSLQEQILDLRLSLALAREKHTHHFNSLNSESLVDSFNDYCDASWILFSEAVVGGCLNPFSPGWPRAVQRVAALTHYS